MLFWDLAISDIQEALDLFRPLYDATGGGDGFVSLEVAPTLAHDTRGTVAMAHDLWRRLNRPNAMIKIPATPEGMPAIEECTVHGININVTLVFSVEMYVEAAQAYIRGLKRRVIAGKSVDRVASANSLFISRIDAAVDALLDRRAPANGSLGNLRGKTAIGQAKLVYQQYLALFEAAMFGPLSERGAREQRPLWASTGTKDPSYPDLKYVEPLVGRDTINTMPPATLHAFVDHGSVQPDTIVHGVDEAAGTLSELQRAGIDVDAVGRRLQEDGVKQFADSFTTLLGTIREKQRTVASTGGTVR
jgi:transaldolase